MARPCQGGDYPSLLHMDFSKALKSIRPLVTCLHRAAVRQDRGRKAGDENVASSGGELGLGDGDLNR